MIINTEKLLSRIEAIKRVLIRNSDILSEFEYDGDSGEDISPTVIKSYNDNEFLLITYPTINSHYCILAEELKNFMNVPRNLLPKMKGETESLFKEQSIGGIEYVIEYIKKFETDNRNMGEFKISTYSNEIEREIRNNVRECFKRFRTPYFVFNDHHQKMRHINFRLWVENSMVRKGEKIDPNSLSRLVLGKVVQTINYTIQSLVNENLPLKEECLPLLPINSKPEHQSAWGWGDRKIYDLAKVLKEYYLSAYPQKDLLPTLQIAMYYCKTIQVGETIPSSLDYERILEDKNEKSSNDVSL